MINFEIMLKHSKNGVVVDSKFNQVFLYFSSFI